MIQNKGQKKGAIKKTRLCEQKGHMGAREATIAPPKMKVAVLCGGPSLEKGISLNSARSVLDHLSSDTVEIVPIYFSSKDPYAISRAQLYSNTPSDFDFKLKRSAKPLSKTALITTLRHVDMVFPVMHGRFGEDGEIQSLLERHKIPFIGSSAAACKQAFDKFDANEFIRQHGFFVLPSALLKIYHNDHREIIEHFFKQHKIERAIVKPAKGGSSIGVFSVATPSEALRKVQLLFSKRMDTRVVLEPFAQGVEFTVIVLENRFGLPVALPPTEIETDYTEHQIFDFRRKYLPTRHVIWHCPPRFDDHVVEKIQAQAEQIFALLKMSDFARFDGWVLPNGEIWFCDFNPISGMEQNSFLFQQSSRIGLAHADVLRYILANACRRHGVRLPLGYQAGQSELAALEDLAEGESRSVTGVVGIPNHAAKKDDGTKNVAEHITKQPRKEINVLFGGHCSERQVSLMSGTNAWLKLRGSKQYCPHPFLWDVEGNIWRLPYQLALSHTVEEITENCKNNVAAEARLLSFERRARLKLGLTEDKDSAEFFAPQKMTLEEFVRSSVDRAGDSPPCIFNALHGGDGENGNMQALFTKSGIKFNGSGEETSRLCIDKWATSSLVKRLGLPGISSIAGKTVSAAELLAMNDEASHDLWHTLRQELGAKTFVIKPVSDGCSTGIVHLYSPRDLTRYMALLSARAAFAPKGTFAGQTDIIEMPLCDATNTGYFLFECFIETDIFRVKNNQLKYTRRTGWVEMTIGLLEKSACTNSHDYHVTSEIGTTHQPHLAHSPRRFKALNPSVSIAEGEVLSVEEKFQGGTGVNITPPPEEIVSSKIVTKIKQRAEILAEHLGLAGYARIDMFVNVTTGELLIIEVNTLPALTPSTVLYHQALTEHPPIFPRELLEILIALSCNTAAVANR
jgi:D-alanine--D-alanine ligase